MARVLPGQIRRITVDYLQGLHQVHLVDGRVLMEASRAEAPHALAKEIIRATYDCEAESVDLTLPSGMVVTAEIGGTRSHQECVGDRPIVYLDQVHWITLARRLHSPAKVLAPDVKPSERLIDLARAGKVILPLSAAHVTETAKASGRWRRELAPVMLELSRGWQMRSPLQVRGEELRAMLSASRLSTGSSIDVPPVFGLEPWLIFSEGRAQRESWGPTESFPPVVRDLISRLTWVCSLYSVLLEDEAEEQSVAKEIAERWAQSHHQLAMHMRQNPKSPVHARMISRARVTTDMQMDLAKAALAVGMTHVEFQAWLNDGAEAGFLQMPYLGLVREAVHHRLKNADDRWEANDLNDLLFLACAAGYADAVAAERKATDYLKRASKGRSNCAVIVQSLPALIEWLDSHLAR